MKKIALVLACAASLGLWISCDNGAQDLDITLHSGVDKKTYDNKGTVTAKKVTMVTNRGEKVAYDSNGKIIVPTDRKDYYIGVVQELSADEKSVEDTNYWFYNDWDGGTDVTLDNAFVSWESNVSYNNYADASTGTENVTNAKMYQFGLGVQNNDISLWNEIYIQKSGDVYQYGGYWNDREGRWYDYKSTYGSTKLEVSGDMESNFTIGTFLKKLDAEYGEKEEGKNYGEGKKYQRLDEYTEYRYGLIGNVWNDELQNNESVFGYIPTKHSADTSVYYYTDVKFTKN